jgi:hypothetical protein
MINVILLIGGACRWPKKVTFSRSQSVEDVRGNDSDAENEKNCCNCFKHWGPHAQVEVGCWLAAEYASSADRHHLRDACWRGSALDVDDFRFASEKANLK